MGALLFATGFTLINIIVFAFVLSSSSCIPSKDLRAPEDTVTFQLFTRKNPTEVQILENGNLDLLTQSNWNKSLPTKIYAHGWMGNPSAQFWNLRDGYLQYEDCNYIAVDWSVLAQGEYSTVAANGVPVAGSVTGSFIDFLVDQGAPLNSFHLTGFSMGAHVVGIAGATVRSGKLARITGLDPAARDFITFDLPFRLDKSDAEFLDVIHTSAPCIQDPIGHVDFYPNGGLVQPGCPDPDNSCCNHCRAVYLFAESVITDVGFWSIKCESWEDFLNGFCDETDLMPMGNSVPLTAQGVYYLATNAEPPYAMGPIYKSNNE